MGGGINQGNNSARGILTVTARVSNGASRYAMPSPSVSDFVYAALLYPASNENQNFVQGTAGEDGKFVFSFQRPNEKSGLTLEVFAFKAGTATFSEGSALLSGKETGLEVKSDKIDVTKAIALLVNEKSKEPGTVSLKVTVPADCTLEIKELKADGTAESEPHFVITGTAPNFTITQNGAGIPAGAYKVTFTVKKVDDTDNIKEEIIHIFTESINVLPGMRTDTWSGLEKDEAKVITQDMASTTVYVRGAGGWYETSTYNATATASDDNSGSFLSPLATIQKAVDTIIARNDGTSEYTIYIDGTFTATSSAALADFADLSQSLSVKIAGLSASGKAVLDGNNTARGIVVGSDSATKDVTLTLENLIVQNTKYSGGRGGAITLCCKADNSHLIKNCVIKDNNASYGSAIYNTYGSLDLQGCVISGNTTGTSGTVYNGQESAILTMSDVTIENNSADNGGGVFLANDSTVKISDASVIITGNYFNSASTSLSRGTGICVWNGTLELSGSAKIDDGVGFPNDGSSTNHKIVISGALTATAPVATITPSSYTENRPLLTAGTGVTLNGSICDKFAVTPKSDGTEWRVALDGANGVLIRKYAVGDTGPGGGVVCYYSADGFTVNGKTCHYLEGSKGLVGTVSWCPCTDSSGYCDVTTARAIGAGYANTQAILNHPNHASATASNCAAKACAEYSTSTTSAGEWFLPSHNEANEMNGDISPISSSEYLWTSNIYNDTNNKDAGCMLLSSAGSSSAIYGVSKGTAYPFRAMRAF